MKTEDFCTNATHKCPDFEMKRYELCHDYGVALFDGNPKNNGKRYRRCLIDHPDGREMVEKGKGE